LIKRWLLGKLSVSNPSPWSWRTSGRPGYQPIHLRA